MAEKRYSIRIYDKKINDRLLKVYDDLPITFPNMNVLIVELIDRGLRTLEKEIYNKKENASNQEMLADISHKVDEVQLGLKIVQERQLHSEIADKITHKVLGCNNAILVGINNGKPKDDEYVEKGFYDKLPDRIVALIDKLIKEQ